MSLVTRTCEHCGGEFQTKAYRLLNGRGKFCSRSCSSTKNTTGHRRAWKGGRRLFEGYWIVYAPGHPNATINQHYAFEHRIVASELLGRPLTGAEVVHHLNGDKLDNSPENIAVTSQSSHVRDHHSLLNLEQKRHALILLALGCSLRQVAEFFRCSISVIHKVDVCAP